MDRLRARVDDLPPARTFLLVLVLLVATYLPTATYDYRINVDAAMAAMPAWNLVENGTLNLAQHEDLLRERAMRTVHLVEQDGRYLSNRTVGVVAWGVPFYAMFSPWIGGEAPFPMYPAALAGVMATALGVSVLHLVFRTLVTPWQATVGAFVAGLGTGAWSVAADGLWPHGPGILFLSLALLAASRNRLASSGLAFGAALVVRPYAALAAAASGAWTAWAGRSPRPLVKVGVPAALGVLALLAYNHAVYGQPSLSGGYGEMSYVQTAGDIGGRDWVGFAQRLAGAFVDPARGMLWYSPFLIVLAFGVGVAWRRSPTWARGAAFGGLAMLVAQFWVQPSQGGMFFFGSRYSIEPLTLAAPLLLVAWRDWADVTEVRRRAFRIAVVVAVALQAFGAAFEPYKWG